MMSESFQDYLLNKIRYSSFIRIVKNSWLYVLNKFAMQSVSKWNTTTNNNSIIKVGFIVQMPEIWEKQKPVYDLMCLSKEFDPWLICIPHYDFSNNELSNYGQELDFFTLEANGNNIIKAFDNNEWIDLKPFRFDYVFYQRPYEKYLPIKYKSRALNKYTRVCYIPYATLESKNYGVYPPDFFRNVYLGFMTDSFSAGYNNNRYSYSFERFVNVGYPSFEECLKLSKTCNYRNVLWTPRWTCDAPLGGSHFFDYNSILTNYHWNTQQLIIRPHPLMWSNFKKEKLLEDKEIENIISKWTNANIRVDTNEKVQDTFDGIDVLISDISSIIPMFFLTGKPIIFCPPKIEEYSEPFSLLLPGLYVAHNKDELETELINLFNKEDRLANVRVEIIKKYYDYHCNASENIIDAIKNDYYND